MVLFRCLGLLCLAALSGSGGPPPAAKTASKQTAPLPDAEVEAAIRKRFAASKIAVNGFTVHVRGGTATIEGKTNVLQHKGTATRLARNAGARRVANRVEVTREARLKASDNLRKARKRAQVKRSDPRSAPRGER